MLFWKRSASGVMLRPFSRLAGLPLTLLFLPNNALASSASGLLGATGGPEGVRS